MRVRPEMLVGAIASALLFAAVTGQPARPSSYLITNGCFLADSGPSNATAPSAAAGNLALASGTMAYAKDGSEGSTTYLNDGLYGDDNSWASSMASRDSYVGLIFPALADITSVAWGRDNTGTYLDHNLGVYAIEYTRASPVDPADGWTHASFVFYNDVSYFSSSALGL